MDFVDSMSVQELADVMWALHKLGAKAREDVYARVIARSLALIPTTHVSFVSNLIVTFAQIGVAPGSELMRVCTDRLAEAGAGLNAVEAANAMWAWGTIGGSPIDERLYETLSIRMRGVGPTAHRQRRSRSVPRLS
jgi:hypothetical protein